MKITIKAKSGEHNAENVNILHGVDYQEDFVEYLDYRDYLFAYKLKSGYMKFVVENGELYTLTEYSAKEPLLPEELKELIDYTQGQWSDGIGESFEQFACAMEKGEEIYVSPWYHGQVAEAIIEN